MTLAQPSTPGTWVKRFGFASLINGFIFLVMSMLTLMSNLSVSQTIAGGSAGTWYTIGYLLLGIVGVAGIFLSGVAYYLFAQANTGNVYNSRLAWLHLLFMDAGAVGTSLLLAWAGYGAAAMLRAGIETQSVHLFLVQFEDPIAAFMVIAALGALTGIVNLAATLVSHRK
jgi:hypothetical protein